MRIYGMELVKREVDFSLMRDGKRVGLGYQSTTGTATLSRETHGHLEAEGLDPYDVAAQIEAALPAVTCENGEAWDAPHRDAEAIEWAAKREATRLEKVAKTWR
jgi:hypothetical protein